MSIQEIEQAVKRLSREEVEQLQDWIATYLEDELELSDNAKASVDRAREDIAAGRHRVRQP